ncbi:MAG: serine/threonine protein kinase, partial [Planctomycetia bacterium]|nr:serine/threonine protein kinase [Planctomycetia bacterium]
MSSDFTFQQTPADQQRSKDLSLQRTRPPAEVPGYQTQRFLGAGAYGEVWVGLDRNTGRKVAIKFYLHRRGVDWSLLSREVEKLRFLSADRYVVQLLDVGWDAEPPYYVMEYIEHGSLDERMRRLGAFPVAYAAELFEEIAVGLAHAHGKGVVHCDLKPANILIDQDGKPRLADFGQSRLSHEQKPALGTLFYMAPEQADLQAVPDVRWDVYALGA